jgi:hypothetical protein
MNSNPSPATRFQHPAGRPRGSRNTATIIAETVIVEAELGLQPG